MNLLCVIPFHQGDVALAADMLKWIRELNSCKDHPCLLVADGKTGLKAVDIMLTLARDAFQRATVIFTKDCDGGWPVSANKMFKQAAAHIAQREHQPFLWLEPDCVPLKTSWLSDIANEYAGCGKPYMGAMIPCDKQGLPSMHMNGNGVYPHNAILKLGKELDSETAFDIACAELIVPNAANTTLIHHVWGKKGLPPTFAENRKREDPENTMTLANIPLKAGLFHRCKDRSLTAILRQRMNTNSIEPLIHNYKGQKRADVLVDTA